MNRGDGWLAAVGRTRRPVLVLTRTEVLDVRSLVTVAEISTSARGLAAEVAIDHVAAGLDRECVVNCDGLHTIPSRHSPLTSARSTTRSWRWSARPLRTRWAAERRIRGAVSGTL